MVRAAGNLPAAFLHSKIYTFFSLLNPNHIFYDVSIVEGGAALITIGKRPDQPFAPPGDLPAASGAVGGSEKEENNMSHILPYAAHGSKVPVAKISPKYEGKGDARRLVGSEFTGLLPFDGMAPVPIVIPGLDMAALPTQEAITDRNMKLDLLVGDFQGLVIEFSGGDYGAVRYKGRATGVTFPNLTPTPGNAASK